MATKNKLFIIILLAINIILIYHLVKNIEKFSTFHKKKRDDKKIGVIIIATNSYFLLGLRFMKQWMHYYDSDIGCKFYFFSDKNVLHYVPKNFHKFVRYIETRHDKWEDATNSKFQNFINIESDLKRDNITDIFYFDADTTVKKKFDHKWFMIGDLVGGQHYNDHTKEKPYDRNFMSAAYIPENTRLPQTYYYGAFFGGKVSNVMNFCRKLIQNQQKDKKINYEPIWNDESYINNYFHYNKPSTVLNKDFEKYFTISDKNGFEGHYKDIKNNWNDHYLKSLKKDKDCVFNNLNIKEKKYECPYSLYSEE
jgi:hypothetical protein